MNEEMLREAGKLHQEIQQMEQHSSLIDDELISLEKLYLGLANFETGKEEVLASMGKGIFFPAKITGIEMFVEVGAGIVVKKNKEEVRKLIEKQIDRMRKSRIFLRQELETRFSALQEFMQELEKQKENEQMIKN